MNKLKKQPSYFPEPRFQGNGERLLKPCFRGTFDQFRGAFDQLSFFNKKFTYCLGKSKRKDLSKNYHYISNAKSVPTIWGRVVGITEEELDWLIDRENIGSRYRSIRNFLKNIISLCLLLNPISGHFVNIFNFLIKCFGGKINGGGSIFFKILVSELLIISILIYFNILVNQSARVDRGGARLMGSAFAPAPC